LAEAIDGRPTGDEGLLLAVGGDKRQRRWIRQVSRIEVRSALADAVDAEKAAPDKATPDGKATAK
jgi:hypothetical protein